MPLGKSLRFIVHGRGIDLDQAKAKVIQDMEPPTNCKLLKSHMRTVSYIHRFIPTLVELLYPFHKGR